MDPGPFPFMDVSDELGSKPVAFGYFYEGKGAYKMKSP